MPALLDDNLEVREVATQLLIAHPDETSKALQPLVDSGHNLMARMTTSVLVRINRKYEARIYEHINNILSDIYLNINRMLAIEALKHYPIVEIVQSIIAEENDRLLDEIFYLLGSIHGQENVEIAVEAIRSSVPRTRANGIEALDVMLSLHLLTAIETATNPDLSLADLSKYGNMTYKLGAFTPQQVLTELLDPHNEDWIVYIGIEALGELGTKLYESQSKKRATSPLDLLSAIKSSDTQRNRKALDIPFTLEQIEKMLESLQTDLPLSLRTALRKARNAIKGIQFERSEASPGTVTSEVERIIFLKRVQFFHDVTVNQLRKVANICQEAWYDEGQTIFKEDDGGGQLFVIVEGRAGIEHTQEDGKSARLHTLSTEDSFGEDTLFDGSRQSTTAIALARTLVLRLDNDDLVGLIQSHPEMSLNIIRILSQEIREIDKRITSIAKQESQAESLFDKLEL